MLSLHQLSIHLGNRPQATVRMMAFWPTGFKRKMAVNAAYFVCIRIG